MRGVSEYHPHHGYGSFAFSQSSLHTWQNRWPRSALKSPRTSWRSQGRTRGGRRNRQGRTPRAPRGRDSAHYSSSYHDLKINSKIGNRISEVKFLGVIIDECLKFNSHIVSVTKKISKFSIIFYKIRKLLANKNLVDIYHALVYPSIIYGISVWGSACKTKLECLRKIQKRIV